MHPTAQPIPRSTKFRAPGQALPAARLALARDIVAAEVEASAADLGRRIEPGPRPDDRLLRGEDLTLGWVADFAETTVKRVIRRLPADLIGGAAVTRLDRTLTHPHPRLPYRRALRIVAGRGCRLALGEELPPAAQASLVRFCGLLPVQVLFLPGQPRPASVPDGRQGLAYVLPWAGEVVRCELRAAAGSGPGICRLDLARLLQSLLGLAELPPSAGLALQRSEFR